MPCPLVSAQGLPTGESFARSCHRGFHVIDISLRNLGKGVARRRIAGGLIFAARRLHPRSADKFLKPAMMPLQPLHRFLWIFRRGSIFHGVELLRNAHSVSFFSTKTIYAMG